MGELINLKRAKKSIARDGAAKAADTNRARFGRTKAEKMRDEHATKQIIAAVDQHRLDDKGSR